MSSTLVTSCGSCGSTELQSVLRLGSTPPACSMPEVGDLHEQTRYPLELLRCSECSLVQLSCIVDPEIIFHQDYPYSTGNSGQLKDHFEDLARSLHVGQFDLVVDIGANDGTFLGNLDCRRLAIEPTDQIRKAQDMAIVQAPFTAKVARRARSLNSGARYVTASNVLAHVADPHDFLEGVKLLLADDGRFVTENHDLASVTGGQWDTVYHEHLRYYTPGTLASLLEQHGLYVYSEQSIPTHGGSFRSWASKTPMVDAIGVTRSPEPDWTNVQEDARRARWHLRSMISCIRAGGERVGAVGATARATTILGYCGLDSDDIEAVYEVEGSDKIGRYMPGTRIEVRDERELLEPFAPEYVLLLSWHLADRIIPKLHPASREMGYKGAIIVPLPELKIVRCRSNAYSASA